MEEAVGSASVLRVRANTGLSSSLWERARVRRARLRPARLWLAAAAPAAAAGVGHSSRSGSDATGTPTGLGVGAGCDAAAGKDAARSGATVITAGSSRRTRAPTMGRAGRSMTVSSG